HFEVRLAGDYVRGRLKDGSDLPQMPPLRYGIELHFERDRLHLGLEAYRYGRQDKVATNERTTPGYTMLDADASYRFDLGAHSLLVFLRGTNLLDEEARRHSSPLKEFAPLPGRSLHVGFRAEFYLLGRDGLGTGGWSDHGSSRNPKHNNPLPSPASATHSTSALVSGRAQSLAALVIVMRHRVSPHPRKRNWEWAMGNRESPR